MSSTELLTGTVRFFDRAKGFGFLTCPDGADCLIHHSVIKDPDAEGWKRLHAGEPVTFKRVETNKGWSATEVNRLESRPWHM